MESNDDIAWAWAALRKVRRRLIAARRQADELIAKLERLITRGELL